MKKITSGLSLVIMAVMMGLATTCSSTPFDPNKPEMSVNKPPSQAKTYNQFHNDTDR